MGACGGRLKGKWVVGSSHALSRSLLKRWTDRSVDAISAAAVSVRVLLLSLTLASDYCALSKAFPRRV